MRPGQKSDYIFFTTTLGTKVGVSRHEWPDAVTDELSYRMLVYNFANRTLAVKEGVDEILEKFEGARGRDTDFRESQY